MVWTNFGPCRIEGFEEVRLRLRRRGPVSVCRVDKFPGWSTTWCPPECASPTPTGCAWASSAPGTTVMHEGSSLQRRHVRRVDGGGPHLGRCGGRRRLGHRWRRVHHGHALRRRHRGHLGGQRCLLGANAGLGISLGDDCIIEAGLYVTAGTKVTMSDGATVKARRLSGANNLLFRRNSVTGAVEVVASDGTGITSTRLCDPAGR